MKKVLKTMCIIMLLVLVAIVGYVAYTSLHGNYLYKGFSYNITESTGLTIPEPTAALDQLRNSLSGCSIRFDGNTMTVEKTTQSGKKEQKQYEVSFDGEKVVLPEDFFIGSAGTRYFSSIDSSTTTCTKSGKTLTFVIEEQYTTFTVTSTITFESAL